MFFCRSGRQTPLSTTIRCYTFDPCTYHGKQFGVFVDSFSEMQFPLLRLVAFLPCSAVSPSSFGRHWVALPIQSCWPSLPLAGYHPARWIFPLAISYPCRRLLCFPSFSPSPCRACIIPTVGTPVTLKSATTRNLFIVFICHILT